MSTHDLSRESGRLLFAVESVRQTGELASGISDAAMDALMEAHDVLMRELVILPVGDEHDLAAKFRLLAHMLEAPAGEFAIEAEAFQQIGRQLIAFRNSDWRGELGLSHPRYGEMALT